MNEAIIITWEELVAAHNKRKVPTEKQKEKSDDLLAMSAQWGRAESILENANRILKSADSRSSPKAISVIDYFDVIAARDFAKEVLQQITRGQSPVDDLEFNQLVELGEGIGRSFPIEPAFNPTEQFRPAEQFLPKLEYA